MLHFKTYQVRGSLARRALIELMEKGLIKQVNAVYFCSADERYPNNSVSQVVAHSSQMIYTRMIGDKEEDDKEAEGGVVVCYPFIFTRLLDIFIVSFEIRYFNLFISVV